jgi:hypothetical protein
MKIYFTFVLAVLLTSCVSNEKRISDFQGRCKVIGYDSNSESGKACVLELEKQYVMATNSPTPINTNSCSEKDACMFNPSNSRYETCYHVTAGGECAHFGTICTP